MEHYNGGLILKSENSILFRNEGLIKQLIDLKYAEIFVQKVDKMIAEAKVEFKNRIGEDIVRDSLELSNESFMEGENIPNGIHLVYRTFGNKYKFWVTTPDFEVLGIDFGLSRHLDPGFELFFDISIHVEANNANSLQNIALSKGWVELNISYNGSNITGDIAVGIVEIIDKTIAWIKNNDGFLNKLKHYTRELPEVINEINKKYNSLLHQNMMLLEEFEIDESDNLNYLLENGSLVLLHKYSAAGILKRSTTTSVSEAVEKGSHFKEKDNPYTTENANDAMGKGLRSTGRN